MNILQKVFIACIKIYQYTLSPDHSFWAKTLNKPPYCKHFPTCSQYTIESIQVYGAFKGSIKGIFRIMRCMPRNNGGYDPVIKNKK